MPKHDNQSVIPDGKQEITIKPESTIKGAFVDVPDDVLDIIGEFSDDKARIRFYSVNNHFRKLLATRPRFWGLPETTSNFNQAHIINSLFEKKLRSKIKKFSANLQPLSQKKYEQITSEDERAYDELLNELAQISQLSITHKKLPPHSIADKHKFQ